jgi:hypothetical protein
MAVWLAIQIIEIKFSVNFIKIISSFLTHRKFGVLVEGELSTPTEIQAGVPQGSVMALTLYNLYISEAPKSQGSN